MTANPSTTLLRALPSAPPACATVADLAFETGLEGRQVANAVQVLQGRGFLEIVKPGCYIITRAGWTAARTCCQVRAKSHASTRAASPPAPGG